MKKLSKILIPILVIALVIGAFFVIASADDGYEAAVGNKKYETFEEAVKAANKAGGGATVKLLKPVELGEQIKIDASMTIDLNGMTITYKPVEFFQTFITVNADRSESGIELSIVGEGCIDVIDARLFNLKSTSNAPATLNIKGTTSGYGTYIHHEGQYSTIIAGEGASISIEDTVVYLNGSCIDNNGNNDAAANIQLDNPGAKITLNNTTIEQINSNAGLFRFMGDGASAVINGSTVKTTGAMFTLYGGVNKGNDTCEVVKVDNSVLTAENFNGGNDKIINAYEGLNSGTFVLTNTRVASSKIVYASDVLDGSEYKITVKLNNVDVAHANTKATSCFASGHAYVIAENCRISSDGSLGAQTTPEHFTFTNCQFSSKVSDADLAVTGGTWYLVFANPSFPWVYLTEAPEKYDNYDYLYIQSFDGVYLDYLGSRINPTTGNYEKFHDIAGGFNNVSEATIKTGHAFTNHLDGNSYLQYTIIDPYAGTDKASKDGNVKYNGTYFPEGSDGGHDAYFAFGPCMNDVKTAADGTIESAPLALAAYETIVFDFDFKGTEKGFGGVSHNIYQRRPTGGVRANAQINLNVLYTNGKTITIGGFTTTVEDPTQWQHVQYVYRIAETVTTTTTEEIDGVPTEVTTSSRVYVQKVDAYYNGELVHTFDYSYTADDVDNPPEQMYCGGMRMGVSTSATMAVDSANCYDNFTVRAYKNESTRVTTTAQEGHAEDNEVSGVMIGNVVYNSLEEAIAAAEPFDTISLHKDVSHEQINLTKSVKIVSNGYALPSFTYIDHANAEVFAYSTKYIENALYKVLVIDENNHPQYLYPSVSADFVITKNGEIVEAGNGGAAFANAVSSLTGGEKVMLKNDITVTAVITVSAANVQIDLGGNTVTVDPSVATLFKISAKGTAIYSSEAGAVINASGTTQILSVASAGSVTTIGKFTDPQSGLVYPGSNLTVNAVSLVVITSGSATNVIIDGGTYNCIGYNDGDGFLHLKSSGKGANTSFVTALNANFTLNDTANELNLFTVNKKAGRSTYYGMLKMDGCTVYGVNAVVGEGDEAKQVIHSVAGMLGTTAQSGYSTVTVTNTYFYNVAMLAEVENSKGTLTLGRGNFSTVAFNVYTDGVTESNVAYASDIAAGAPKAPVAVSFASSAQTEINVAGNTLAIASLTDPIAYCTAAETDVYVKYTMGDYTSRMIIAAADADLTASDAVPADIYNSVIPAFEGLYTVACSIEGSSVGDDGVTTVTLKSEIINDLKTLSALQLYDSFNYVVYIPKAVITSGLVQSITLDGKVVYTDGDVVSYVTIEGAEYFYIIKEVGATNASTEIELAVTHGFVGSSDVVTKTQTLSLAKYAADVLASSDVDAKGKQIVCDVLYYVNAIRTYTGEQIAADDEIVALIADYEAAGVVPTAKKDTNNNGTLDILDKAKAESKVPTVNGIQLAIDNVAINITKESANIRFVFNTAKYTGNITLTYKDLQGNDVTTTFNVAECDGCYDLDVKAYYFISDITITTEAGEQIGNVYNIASYIEFINKDYAGTAAADLANALYAYAISARAYKG